MTPQREKRELDKESKDSCLRQEWEAENFHFTDPQEGKNFVC